MSVSVYVRESLINVEKAFRRKTNKWQGVQSRQGNAKFAQSL